MNSDEDNIAYLVGEASDALGPAERAELDTLRALLADPATWAEPDLALEDRIVAAIVAEAALPGSEHGDPVTTEKGVVPLRRRRLTIRARTGMVLVAAVAAVSAFTLIARPFKGDDHSVRVTLAATALAPRATGQAKVTPQRSGLRIELRATDLPRRDNGLYYQAWLKSDAGVLVPIGTFHDGDGVVLWAGVSLQDFPTLTVTEEAADGDQASSGRRVLVGTVEKR